MVGQVREYIYQLEAHLSDVQKQASRLIRKQEALAATLHDFGSSMIALSARPPPVPPCPRVRASVELTCTCLPHTSCRACHCTCCWWQSSDGASIRIVTYEHCTYDSTQHPIFNLLCINTTSNMWSCNACKRVSTTCSDWYTHALKRGQSVRDAL